MSESDTNAVANADNQQPKSKASSPSVFRRVQRLLVIFGGIYILLVLLLVTPFFQRHAVYLNSLKFPWFVDLSIPESVGLAPNKTITLQLHTPDNEILGAWLVLSDTYYRTLTTVPDPASDHLSFALQHYPTILFLHGNAATRAFSARVQHYQTFSTRLGVNVLSVDYRGFAESTGTPSEAGVVTDARAAWDWLLESGARAEDVVIVGHSLGTGVAGQLSAQLSSEGVSPRGVALLAPFSSIRELLNTYHILGLVPLMRPISMIPWATNFIDFALTHRFDTLKAVPNITGNVFIGHAEDDWDIPYTHSEVLFNAFIDPHLPELKLPENPLAATVEEWKSLLLLQQSRLKKREELIHTSHTPHFGEKKEVSLDGRNVAFVKTLVGGHDYVGVQEGLQDAMRAFFKL